MKYVAEAIARAAFGLAGRLADGATLWAVAPGLDDHARHVAVEFVHPVVVGTRAVPAFALAGPDLVPMARMSWRAGDVAVLIGPEVAELTRRCRAWGVTTITIGWGRPMVGDAPFDLPADHVIRVSGEADVVRCYHLLWELTHICLERADLRSAPAPDNGCVVCGDDAVLGEVTAIGESDELLLRTACGPIRADGSLLPGLAVGDLVLAHAGVVIGRDTAHEVMP